MPTKQYSTYDELRKDIEQEGFYTSFRSTADGGILVCVSRRDEKGRLCGNSFLILRRMARWYITTWGAHLIYSIPTSVDLLDLCAQCLQSSTCPLGSIPDTFIQRFNLQLISEKEKEMFFPEP